MATRLTPARLLGRSGSSWISRLQHHRGAHRVRYGQLCPTSVIPAQAGFALMAPGPDIQPPEKSRQRGWSPLPREKNR